MKIKLRFAFTCMFDYYIVVVKKTANSATALSKENKSSIEQLQQEIADLKRDHKLEIDTLKQNQVTQQFET